MAISKHFLHIDLPIFRVHDFKAAHTSSHHISVDLKMYGIYQTAITTDLQQQPTASAAVEAAEAAAIMKVRNR